jgi:hypothetical protein
MHMSCLNRDCNHGSVVPHILSPINSQLQMRNYVHTCSIPGTVRPNNNSVPSSLWSTADFPALANFSLKIRYENLAVSVSNYGLHN